VRVEVVAPERWAAWRDLRLEALADTPIGFGEHHADALLRSDEDWRLQPLRPGVHLIAWDGDEPVGMSGGFTAEDGRPTVFGVYVRPVARGKGVLDRLVAGVEDWARGTGSDVLRLEVHEDNGPALAAYLRLGFALTGARRPYNLDESRELLEMVRPL
jgi:GNAT superfamily N-acetyltransferase